MVRSRFASVPVVIVLTCFLLASISSAQEAVAAHRRTLDELVDESAFIVHGHVVNIRIEPHPQFNNLSTAVITMDVSDVLKGDVPRKFVFRQFVWDLRAAHDSGYKRRQELLLFLRPPSRYGLTSPAGLSQGRFVIRRDASGNVIAANADDNVGLFKSLPAAAQRRRVALPASAAALARQTNGPVALRDLKQVLRSLVGRPQ